MKVAKTKSDCWTIRKIFQISWKIVVLFKVILILRYICKGSSSKHQTERVIPKPGLGDVYNEVNKTFKILNQENATFTIEPSKGCSDKTELLILVSSSTGLRFQYWRDSWRQRTRKYSEDETVKIIFLIATPPTDNVKEAIDTVKEEATKYNDIVMTSVIDGHRKLSYKTLSGYVWSYLQCRDVPYVAKTDDNVILDMDKLLQAVQTKSYHHPKWIACTTPNRNTRTIRGSHFHMTGNWSISEDQFPWSTVPDWCTGFLYITSPLVGAQLVQAGYALYNNIDVEQGEDTMITGVLRDAIGDIEVDTYETGIMSQIWLHYLSHCSFLTGFKITFFNSYIMSKRSSRSDTWYVGSITDLPVLRYFLCFYYECWIRHIEQYILLPKVLYDVCIR